MATQVPFHPDDSLELPCAAEPRKPRRLTSAELMGQGQELVIQHAGFDYRLRITRQGKLILTK